MNNTIIMHTMNDINNKCDIGKINSRQFKKSECVYNPEKNECVNNESIPDSNICSNRTGNNGGQGLQNCYRGKQNKTISGYTCQQWKMNPGTYEHKPNSDVEKALKEGTHGLGSHNYCRNPDDSSKGIWCYTTNPDKRWEYCNPLTVKKHD